MKNSVIKKLVPMFFAAHTSLICAATHNPYVGAGIGYSHLNDIGESQQQNQGGLGGRVFAGYNINQYIGIEGHFAMFHRANYELDENPWLSVNYDLLALGLAGKLSYPASDTFNLYLSLGGAEMMGKLDALYNGMFITTDSANALVLTVGFGANVDLTQNITAGIDLTLYQGKGADYTHNGIPQSQIGTLSLAYQF